MDVQLPTGRDVLVVEDEVRIRKMLSEALRQMGFTAELTPSAEAAMRALHAKHFDIVILDLNLPGMNGLEFLEAARKQHRDIEVIILTGFGDLQAAQKAIRLDVVDFISKPFALGTLEKALDRARKRARERLVGPGESEASAPARLQFETAPEPPPASPPAHETPTSDPASMDEVEQRHILEILRKNNGNRAATASELGISLRKLYYRIGEYQRKGVDVR